MAQASRLGLLAARILRTGGTPVPPGVEMTITLEPIEDFRQIRIDRTSAPSLDPEAQRLIDDAWAKLCAENPRYFNSPMLSFESSSSHNADIVASVRPYMLHAVRDTIDVGISLLAVTAVVVLDDRVLIGKRSTHSHRYGGLWELGPSGGIDGPDHADAIDREGLLAEALREVEEEAGFFPEVIRHHAVALIHDHLVGSADIAVVMEIKAPQALRVNWEYDETRWVTLDELVAWCDQKSTEIIPTTIALARFLHEACA
ncbi:MAG: NUDIX hydrolase [Phycisphaerales bacterium]